jgi:hypothetical protein
VSTTKVLSSSAANAFAVVINVGIAVTAETHHLLLLLMMIVVVVELHFSISSFTR